MKVVIREDVSGLTSSIDRAIKAMSQTSSGPLRDGFNAASAVYLGFTRQRFNKFSKGGGDWPDLALSTKVARLRKTKSGKRKYDKVKKVVRKDRRGAKRERVVGTLQLGGSNFAILRDTSILFNSLTTGSPGNINEMLPNGVRVGTAIRYARHHQNPGRPGRPPQRKILVSPDVATNERIKSILSMAIVTTLETSKR
jgi:hypothetical protein